MLNHDRLIFIARLPRTFIWPVIYGLHAANHLRWPSVAYPCAAIMVVLYVLMLIAERAVPDARPTG